MQLGLTVGALFQTVATLWIQGPKPWFGGLNFVPHATNVVGVDTPRQRGVMLAHPPAHSNQVKRQRVCRQDNPRAVLGRDSVRGRGPTPWWWSPLQRLSHRSGGGGEVAVAYTYHLTQFNCVRMLIPLTLSIGNQRSIVNFSGKFLRCVDIKK